VCKAKWNEFKQFGRTLDTMYKVKKLQAAGSIRAERKARSPVVTPLENVSGRRSSLIWTVLLIFDLEILGQNRLIPPNICVPCTGAFTISSRIVVGLWRVPAMGDWTAATPYFVMLGSCFAA